MEFLSWHLDQVELAFLDRVETEEAKLLGWWSSDRLRWVLAGVLWWVQIRFCGGF